MNEQRELKTFTEQLHSHIALQDEQIAAQTETIHDFEAQIVKTSAAIRAALAALQTGTALDVLAAIEILRGVK
jgi:hypothetical protein